MVNSVARAVDILFFVSKQKCSSTLSDIASELDIPKSTAFNIIRTLTEKNLLAVTDTRRLTVSLGAGIYTLASGGVSGADVRTVVQPQLKQLSAEIGRSTAFYLCGKEQYTLLNVSTYSGTPYPNVTVGQAENIRDGEYGLTCLAAVDAQRAQELLAQLRSGEAEPAAERVEQIRRQGYDVLLCDKANELYSVTVPVEDSFGVFRGFICTYLFDPQTESKVFSELVATVQAAAVQVGNRISFLP